MNGLNRFVEIIEDFKAIRDKTNLQVTADALFTNARALFISERIAQQRSPINQFEQVKIEAPATEKQINYLRALGVPISDGLTKKEAFLLIKKETEE